MAEKDDHNASDVTLAKNIEWSSKVVQRWPVAWKKIPPIAPCRIWSEILGAFEKWRQRRVPQDYERSDRHGREHNQDVIDTAVELFEENQS